MGRDGTQEKIGQVSPNQVLDQRLKLIYIQVYLTKSAYIATLFEKHTIYGELRARPHVPMASKFFATFLTCQS